MRVRVSPLTAIFVMPFVMLYFVLYITGAILFALGKWVLLLWQDRRAEDGSQRTLREWKLHQLDKFITLCDTLGGSKSN